MILIFHLPELPLRVESKIKEARFAAAGVKPLGDQCVLQAAADSGVLIA